MGERIMENVRKCHRCGAQLGNAELWTIAANEIKTYDLCHACGIDLKMFMNGCELKPLITDQIRVMLSTEAPVDAVLVNGAAWDELKKEYGEEIISGVCTIDGTPIYKTVMETMQDKPCFKLIHGIGPTVYAVE